DDDVRAARNGVFSRVEEPAEDRMDVEKVKERRVDAGHLMFAGGLSASDRQAPLAEAGKLGEGRRPPAQIEIASILEGRARTGAAVDRRLEVHAVNGARVAKVWERANHEAIDHAEHRRVGADAQRERQRHGDGESRGSK